MKKTFFTAKGNRADYSAQFINRVNEHVMKEKNKNPRKSFTLNLSVEDYNKIYDLYSASFCRSLTEYIRKVVLRKPVVIKYRNQTADDTLAEMIQLKKDMETANRNFVSGDESSRLMLITTFEETCLRIEQIHKLWFNESKH